MSNLWVPGKRKVKHPLYLGELLENSVIYLAALKPLKYKGLLDYLNFAKHIVN